MDEVLALLKRFKYFAMLGILFLCGIGLPVPEELTLLASGFAVGWQWADYSLSCIFAAVGILTGDSVVFWIGRHFGRWFFASRPVRLVLPRRRQASVRLAFIRHGNKSVFFARFVSGFRIGVYAYAGQHGMKWRRFLLLDLLGCLVSVPVIVLVGKVVAQKLADPQQAAALAREVLEEGYNGLYFLILMVVLSVVGHAVWNRFVVRGAGLKLAEECERAVDGGHDEGVVEHRRPAPREHTAVDGRDVCGGARPAGATVGAAAVPAPMAERDSVEQERRQEVVEA